MAHHIKTRSLSAAKSCHIPGFTSGCFSTKGAKEVTVGQKTRGAESVFPTVTHHSRKHSQTRNAEEEQASSSAHPTLPALAAACPCPIPTRSSFVNEFYTSYSRTRGMVPRCNVKAVPCRPAPSHRNRHRHGRAYLRKGDKCLLFVGSNKRLLATHLPSAGTSGSDLPGSSSRRELGFSAHQKSKALECLWAPSHERL